MMMIQNFLIYQKMFKYATRTNYYDDGDADDADDEEARRLMLWLLCLCSLVNRMDGLRQKLEGQGLVNVNYMVVNDNGGQAQRLHSLLANRLPSGIALHKQDPDADVWQAVNGEKDDFLIYDR